ncbi:MAG: polymer-forming cytoskeletal protein [Gammaproteobacteria bacterium]|nr:polymer-forming cytoskeletal protein [Gammaproteobacteria bacterium]
MWGKPRKRRTTRIDTLIGQHSQVLGDVRFNGGLHVDGTIKGNVYAEQDDNSMLSLSNHGTIEGEVRVPYVVLNGVVVGDVYAGEHVELASNARVTGNVYYSLIEMAIGAEVNGKLVHHDEPVRADVPLGEENGALKATE